MTQTCLCWIAWERSDCYTAGTTTIVAMLVAVVKMTLMAMLGRQMWANRKPSPFPLLRPSLRCCCSNPSFAVSWLPPVSFLLPSPSPSPSNLCFSSLSLTSPSYVRFFYSFRGRALSYYRNGHSLGSIPSQYQLRRSPSSRWKLRKCPKEGKLSQLLPRTAPTVETRNTCGRGDGL